MVFSCKKKDLNYQTLSYTLLTFSLTSHLEVLLSTRVLFAILPHGVMSEGIY
jgi:hypothetical protein